MINAYKQRRIAVVGVSENPEKYGHKIFVDLLKEGFNVSGVNLKGGKVEGKKLFAIIKEISPLPDMVVTAVKPEVTEKIIEEIRNLGMTRIWMQPGSESEKAIAKAKDYGMLVTHNKCFMVANGIWQKKAQY
ncbi:CoA-binding protein [Elusimicrobiota bacterium]